MFLLGHSSASAQVTYYVDAVAGNDSNAGTSTGAAWKTLNKVRSRGYRGDVVGGITIAFKGGQTFTDVRGLAIDPFTTAGPFTLTSYGSGQATIHIESDYGFRNVGVSDVTIDNLKFEGEWTPQNQGFNTSSGLIFSTEGNWGNLDNINVRNSTVTGFKNSGILVKEDAAGALQTNTENVTIENCWLTGNGQEGLKFEADRSSPGVTYNHYYAVVKDCLISANYLNGIVGVGMVDGAFTANRLLNNGSRNFDFAAGLRLTNSQGCVIESNEASGNFGTGNGGFGAGFELGNGTYNNTARFNYSHENGSAGFYLTSTAVGSGASNANKLYYNISQNDGADNTQPIHTGIYLSLKVTNSAISNNTVYTSNGTSLLAETLTNSAGNLVANNIFYSNSLGGYAAIVSSADPAQCLLLNNCYYGGVFGFQVQVGPSTVTSLAGLQGFGQETWNSVAHGFVGDPLLQDPGNGGATNGNTASLTNYQPIISSASPILGAAFNVAAAFGITLPTVDYNALSIVAPRNIGASDAKLNTIASLTVSPTTVFGGDSATGTVTLAYAASAGGVTVALSSNSLNVLVPASVFVPEGQETANFTVNTTAAVDMTTGTITGTVSNTSTTQFSTASATLTLRGTGLSIAPSTVVSGSKAVGTFNLGGTAPAGGAQVALTSSGGIQVPTTITVAEGASTATFDIETGNASPGVTATVTATYGAASVQDDLSIVGLSVALSPTVVVSGSFIKGTVTLEAPATAGGLVVTVSGNDATPTITIPEGETVGTWNIDTSQCNPGDSYNAVASSGLAYDSEGYSVKGLSVTIPSNRVVSGSHVKATVTLEVPATEGGLTLTLAATNGMSVPPTLQIAEGETTGTFIIDTSGSAVGTNGEVSATSGKAIGKRFLSISGLAVTFSPYGVFPGTDSIGTVHLADAAVEGGLTVSLTSTGGVSIPATVLVPEGASTATFTIGTSSAPPGTASITATSGLASEQRFLDIYGLSLTILQPDITAGMTSNATVFLTGPAPAGGLVVSLSSNKAGVTVPSSVTVLEGNYTENFAITTSAATTTGTATITASHGTATGTATLNVTAATSFQIELYQDKTIVGVPVYGRVVLTGPAPAGGFTVDMSCSNTDVVIHDVVFNAGETTKDFEVDSSEVTGLTGITDVTVRGDAGPVSDSENLSLGLIHMNLAANETTAGIPLNGTVTLDFPAPAGGLSGLMFCSETEASVPLFFSVNEGESVVGFTISSTYVPAAKDVYAIALIGAAQDYKLFKLGALHLSLDTPSASATQNPIAGTVTLDVPAPAGGALVTMTSSNTSVVTVTDITIPAGAVSAPFTMTRASASANGSTNITATYGAATDTKTQAVATNLLVPVGFYVVPNDLVGGSRSIQGNVYLNGPAPAGGLVVHFSSSDPAHANVPGSTDIVVPEGQWNHYWDIATMPVTTTTVVTIQVSAGGVTLTDYATLRPPSILQSFTLNRTSILAGGQLRGTVTLTAPQTRDANVAITSDDPSVTIPSFVKIKAGSTEGSFPIVTSGASADKHVTFTATHEGHSLQAGLDVVGIHIKRIDVSQATMFGGAKYTATVTLTATVRDVPFEVLVSSPNASAPTSVFLPPGESSATFDIVADDVNATTNGVIYAYSASESKDAHFTIKPNVVVSLTLNPNTVRGGSGTVVTGTVTLSAPLANGGSVSLSCPSPRVSVPGSVSIASGSKVGTFTVGHSATSIIKSTTVKAARKGAAKTAGFTINP